MPAHSKGLTWAFKARLTETDRAAIEAVVAEYAEYDITISLNDGVRILIRRGSERPPADVAGARGAIVAHWHTCEACTEAAIGCPDGQRLKEAYDRLLPTPALPGADAYAAGMARAVKPAGPQSVFRPGQGQGGEPAGPPQSVFRSGPRPLPLQT